MINKIKLHKFDFIDKEYGKHNDCGYIAQELKSIFPEAVIDVPQDKEITGYDSLYQIDDSKLIPYLVKSYSRIKCRNRRIKKEIKNKIPVDLVSLLGLKNLLYAFFDSIRRYSKIFFTNRHITMNIKWSINWF